MLLERKYLSPDMADEYGRTPLLKAALWGYEGIVKALLEREDVDPNAGDDYGETPLFETKSHGK